MGTTEGDREAAQAWAAARARKAYSGQTNVLAIEAQEHIERDAYAAGRASMRSPESTDSDREAAQAWWNANKCEAAGFNLKQAYAAGRGSRHSPTEAIAKAKPLEDMLQSVIAMERDGGVASQLFVPIVIRQWADGARAALESWEAFKGQHGNPYR